MVQTSESEFKGIKAIRFEAPQNMFVEKNPQESCYCLNKTKDQSGSSSCFMDGVIDLHSCFGSPILASFPHFLYSVKYRNGTIGLSAIKDDHSSYCDMEPNTGTPLRGAKRIQFNMVIRPIEIEGKILPETELIQGTVLPIIWVEESAELTDEYIHKLNEELLDVLAILDGVKWGFISISVVVIIISVISIILCKK